MKKLLIVLALITSTLRVDAQAVNPQNTFSNVVTLSGPSLWLRFNDATTNFSDAVSRQSLSSNVVSYNGVPVTGVSSGNAGGTIGVNAVAFTTSGTLKYILFQAGSGTPATTQTFVILSGTSPSLTIVASFTATVAATAGPQLLVAGVNFTGPAVLSGEHLGNWVATGNSVGYASGGSNGVYYLTGQATLPVGARTYSSAAGSYAVVGGIVTSTSLATAQQPGFDSTNATQYSAEFPYNSYNYATNNTLGAFDWYQPQTLMIQIDRLNWTRSGSLVLASKGDLGSCAGLASCTNNNSWWQVFLTMSGSRSEVCFERGGYGAAIGTWGGTIGSQICTNISGANPLDAVPNGFNYNIIVKQAAGTGAANDLSMWINGLQVGSGSLPASPIITSSGSLGFGAYQLTVTGGGTGYANPTYFTSTGGGANCVVGGYIPATSGVLTTGPYGVFFQTADSGCTSAPTIVLTSPTGAGWTYTLQASGASMNGNFPVMAPGYVSSGTFYGPAGSSSTQTPTYVDEFAEFPSSLSIGQMDSIFYGTKFYQLAANTVSPKPVVIVSEDGCGDTDNIYMLSMAIRLHQLGLITLGGVDDSGTDGTSEAFFRQLLDQAGLNDIPVAVPTGSMGEGYYCLATNLTAYNANIPQITAGYESSATMYRTVFTKYPTRPIFIANGGQPQGIYQFMISPADGISPLTGLQLWNQDAANGGAVYLQGGGCGSQPAYPITTPCTGSVSSNGFDSAAGQYIANNNGSMPLTWIGGTPQVGGPGPLVTRSGNDPLWLYFHTLGNDIRSCWDCMTLEAIVSSYFTNGVQITYSGGTGYAASTPFYFSGGGAHCQGAGFITASGGVPNGVLYNWGANGYAQYLGIGSGCSSAPTVNLVGSTGTGGTFTAYPNLVCGTVTVNVGAGTDVFSSAAGCSNHYVVPGSFNTNQNPQSGVAQSWFINSLVDPETVGQPRE